MEDKKRSAESKKIVPVYLLEYFKRKTDKKHPVEIESLITYLENKRIYVDKRTIYSAIKLLQAAGFDIIGQRGYKEYKYYLGKRDFNQNELKFLIDAVATSKFLTEKKARELIRKIKTLGCEFESEQLNRNLLLGKRQVVTMNDLVLQNLDKIYFAIGRKQSISFQYMKWNEKGELSVSGTDKKYFVSPYAVTLTDDYYYMIAFSEEHNEIRHYRVDKMKAIEQTGTPRRGEDSYKNFDVVSYTQKTFEMFGGREETVSVQCDESMLGVFFERFGANLHYRPDFDNDKKYICRVTVYVSPQFFSWIFALGEHVKIIEPFTVAEEYRAMLKSVINNYLS